MNATRKKEFRRKLFGDTQQGFALHHKLTKPEQAPPLTQVAYEEKATLQDNTEKIWIQCPATILPGMVLKHKTKGTKQVKKVNTDGSIEIHGCNVRLAENDASTVEVTTTEVAYPIKEAWKPILTTLHPVAATEWKPVLDLFEAVNLPPITAQDMRERSQEKHLANENQKRQRPGRSEGGGTRTTHKRTAGHNCRILQTMRNNRAVATKTQARSHLHDTEGGIKRDKVHVDEANNDTRSSPTYR